jgi:hypothetical protein
MKLLNIDMHIGVRDLQHTFEKLGHTLDVWSLSDHHKLMGWERAKVDIVNEKTWWNLDQGMCDRFYARYKDEFKKYDGFVTFYPTAFSLLYEKFDKPIIVVNALRYELPFMGNPHRWNWLTSYLQKGIDGGQIIPIVNDKMDQQYLRNYVHREFQHIPGLCEYAGLQYVGDNGKFLYCSKFDEFHTWLPNVPMDAKQPGHSWDVLPHYKALVYVPYVNITMSLFEQYAANIPLLFPTHEFLMQLWSLYRNQGVMSEMSHRKIFGLTSGTPKEVKFDGLDLNDYDNKEAMNYWSSLSDFYDSALMPGLAYFDSVQELEDQLNTLDFPEISFTIELANEEKRDRVYNAWEDVFRKVK